MDLNVKIEKSNDYLEEDSEVVIKISKYDHNKKAELVRRINKIKKKEYLINIFNIITASSKDYTENTNGVFIFFHNLEDEVYEKIESYVNNIYKLHKKNLNLKNIINSELSDSIIGLSETINDIDNEIDNDNNLSNITNNNNSNEQLKDINKQLSNKEKMIIKRKKYEQYLNKNQLL
jgi:hypothetical protein